ncbi:MAG: DUF4276 family protein [Phycisphaerae bacterium]
MIPYAGKMIIPFGEGEGEELALPKLIKRVLQEALPSSDYVPEIQVAHRAWRVGHLEKLRKNDGQIWKEKLTLASEKKNASAVLLLLDGDRPDNLGSPPHCVGTVASQLAAWAREVGAGKVFSVAVVIARQEMESWFIAGADSLRGVRDSNGLLLGANLQVLTGDLESSPRDAKDWLNRNMPSGYKPTADQVRLAQRVDLKLIRDRKLRSFQRFDNALAQIQSALTSGRHIATP